MRLKIVHLLILGCFYLTSVFGQSPNPNIDYESGTTSYWHFFTGSCCPISTPVSTSAILNRHTLTSGTSIDPYGLFPIISPDGGSYSLRLGNSLPGAEAEKARYYIHVPASSSEFSILFRYAVVFQDPGHPPSAQPRFEVKAYDSATNDPIPCAQFTYVADSTLPGFHRSLLDTSVFYKGWTTGNINLTGRGGTTITMDFASGDCALGAHFGYGYLDMSAGLFAITTNKCSQDSVTLHAPPGFDLYSWYDSTFTTLLGTSDSIILPATLALTKYGLILRPISGYGCEDTLYTSIRTSSIQLQPDTDRVICPGEKLTLNVRATDTTQHLTYSWIPTTGLSCADCKNPTTTIFADATYIVKVANTFGCQVYDTIHVLLDTISVAISDNTIICKKTDVTLVSSTNGAVEPLTYVWAPAAGLSCTACAVPTASPDTTTSYMLTVTDGNNCTVHDSVRVFLDTLKIYPFHDTSICQGYPVKLSAYIIANVSPVNYSWSPPDGLSCTYCSDPDASPNSTTTYYVTVTDADQCSATDTVVLTIDPCNIAFPSAFTPDNDGLNDIIRVVGQLDFYSNFSLSIFNRWGARVFYTNDISAGWDGVYNGTPQNIGTYFYLIEYSLYGAKHLLKGDFQLVR